MSIQAILMYFDSITAKRDHIQYNTPYEPIVVESFVKIFQEDDKISTNDHFTEFWY